MVCNADESEPGTFKDRFILTHLPHLVIEGMILAGVLTGARTGILYIRHEYEEQEEILALLCIELSSGGDRWDAENAQGRHLTMEGPISLVTDTGSFCQSRMANR